MWHPARVPHGAVYDVADNHVGEAGAAGLGQELSELRTVTYLDVGGGSALQTRWARSYGLPSWEIKLTSCAGGSLP